MNPPATDTGSPAVRNAAVHAPEADVTQNVGWIDEIGRIVDVALDVRS